MTQTRELRTAALCLPRQVVRFSQPNELRIDSISIDFGQRQLHSACCGYSFCPDTEKALSTNNC